MQRPKSITGISIAALLFGMLTLAPKIYVISSEARYQAYTSLVESFNGNEIAHIPIGYQTIHGIVGSFIWIIAGIFMLKGHNWSRLLALFWGMSVLILTLLSTGASAILYLKLSTYFVLLYFLFNSTSNRFFQKDNV